MINKWVMLIGASCTLIFAVLAGVTGIALSNTQDHVKVLSAQLKNTKAQLKDSQTQVNSCLNFLGKADNLVGAAGAGIGLASDWMDSYTDDDVIGMMIHNQELNDLAPEVAKARTSYDNAASTCDPTHVPGQTTGMIQQYKSEAQSDAE